MPPERLLDPFFNSAAAYRFLMEIFSEIKRGGEKEDDKLLKKIRNHILVHMEHTPSLEELALLADCSPWHFARKFQKISGMAPRQFVLSLKMQYAAQLLHNTLDPIKEVARKCGYDDPSYFCRVFRKYHNTSPAEFRENGSGEW
jgi:AraC-like DNA-binding protein